MGERADADLELGEEIGGDNESSIFDDEFFVFDVDLSFDVGQFDAFLAEFVQSPQTVTSTGHTDETDNKKRWFRRCVLVQRTFF